MNKTDQICSTSFFALHFLLLFTGLGSALYIVNKLNYKLQTKLDVLYPERIHGIIEAAENKLIIFGGKSLRICKLDITNNSIK